MAPGIINARTLRAQALFLVVAIIPQNAAAARPSILVPESADPERCFALESVAAMIAMTPGVRLIRAPEQTGEALDSARQRSKADLAIAGERKTIGADKFKASIELAGKVAATGSAEGTEPSIAALLAPLWPKDLPALAAGDAFAAASPRALDAACKGDSGTSYAISGAAVGEALRRLVDPIVDPKNKKEQPLLFEWARGESAARKKRWPETALILRRTLDRLKSNESAPLWRRTFETEAASPDIKGGAAIVLDSGRFVARAVESGRLLWSIEVGVAEPRLFDAGRGLLIATNNSGVTAIDAQNGAIKWKLELNAPMAEIAERGDALLIANAEEVRAVHRLDGRELWRFESTANIAAGPAIAGGRVVLPLEAELLLLDSEKGARINRARLGDELSSPLFSTDRAVWTALGAVQLAYADLSSIGEREPPIKKITLPGVIWPPLAMGSDLLIATKDKRRGAAVMRVPADASGDPKVWFRGGIGPLLPLPALDSVALFTDKRDLMLAIGRDGKVRWRDKTSQRIAGAAVFGGALWTASGDRVRALDPANGKPLVGIGLGEQIKEIGFGEAGSLVLVEGGAYGLPHKDDPRPRAWLRAIRLRLAESYIALNRAPAAEEMIRAVLERDPGDIEALALAARATKDLKKTLSAWLGLASQIPLGDPLETQALEALRAAVGLETRVPVDEPIRAVATSSDGVAAYQSGARVVALAGDLRAAPRWSRVGSLLLPRGLYFKVDGDYVRAADGTIAGKQAPDRVLRTEFVGARVDVFDAATSATVASSSFKTPVRAAVLSGNRALIALDRELQVLDLSSNKIVARAPAIPAPKRRIHPFSAGWIVVQGPALSIIDLNGKTKGRIALPSPPLEIVTSGEKMFATLERGGLVAVDLSTAKLRGKIEGVELGPIAAGGGKVFAATKGALLVFDADRMFSPQGLPGRSAPP